MKHITYCYLNFIYFAWNYDHFWNILFIKHAYTLLLLISINLFIHVFLKKINFMKSIIGFPWLNSIQRLQVRWLIYELIHGFMRSSFRSTFFSHWGFKKHFKIGTEVKKKISHLIIFTVKLCENKVLGIDDLLFYISNFFFILIRNYFNIIRLGVHV